MSTVTPGQVIQNLVILNQQGLEFEDYEKLHAGYLAALAQATKRGKLPELSAFRKAIGLGILSLVVPHVHCCHSAAFCVGDRFVVDKSAAVPISFLNENWELWFGGMELGEMAACDLEVHALTENSLDKPITDEIGEEFCDTSPAALWSMMRDGHLSQDKWYVFYMKDQSGVRRAVRVCWYDGGWFVCAYSSSGPRVWGAGHHVVSRKRCVAQA